MEDQGNKTDSSADEIYIDQSSSETDSSVFTTETEENLFEHCRLAIKTEIEEEMEMEKIDEKNIIKEKRRNEYEKRN